MVKCSRVASAVGAMSRAMGGAVVELVGLKVRVRRVHRVTRREGASVPWGVGACREAALALAMVRGWRRAVLRAEHIARACLLQNRCGEAAGYAVWNMWSRNPDGRAMVGSCRGRSPVGSGAGAGPRGSRSLSSRDLFDSKVARVIGLGKVVRILWRLMLKSSA